jgi:hypothetical protein
MRTIVLPLVLWISVVFIANLLKNVRSSSVTAQLHILTRRPVVILQSSVEDNSFFEKLGLLTTGQPADGRDEVSFGRLKSVDRVHQLALNLP